MSDKMKIVYRDLDELKYLPKNFKRHDLEEAEASINLRGFIDPIGFNPATGHAFDGNGRLEVLKIMRDRWRDDKTKPVPARITVKGLNWLVPTVDIEMTEDEEIAAAAALNRIPELGGYDEAFQLEVLQEMAEKGTMVGTGWTDADLKVLIKRFGAPEPDANDEVGKVNDELKNLGNDSGEPTGGGIKTHAATSNIKQVQLLYAPAQHTEFLDLTLALGKSFNTNNVSDTVLAALKKANEAVSSKAGT